SAIQHALIQWYHQHQRVLPWRQPSVRRSAESMTHGQDSNTMAYAVWISEVMCQQTQISVVTDYFERWIAKWPTVQALAAAQLSDVHQAWAGLGYYSRATRLHEAAQYIVNQLDGSFPTVARLIFCWPPGVGPYTASAVASIVFAKRVGVVDGNVNRVLSRLGGIAVPLTQDAAKKWMWRQADTLADHAAPGQINQAMMELGALICTPKSPQCHACPLAEHC
ncbi:uncharacterized protein MONBRDRAFT_2248, partial [Monosiga brevicollis MX1]